MTWTPGRLLLGQTCFPNAVIVADRYHVVRQVFWAMERVRKKLADWMLSVEVMGLPEFQNCTKAYHN